MKLNCIIVDDEPIARQIIEQYAADDSRLEAKNPVSKSYRMLLAAFIEAHNL